MSERIEFHGCLRRWIAALWCEYVLATDPVASEAHDDFVVRYLLTFFRFPELDRTA